jgi:hypothetical protein
LADTPRFNTGDAEPHRILAAAHPDVVQSTAGVVHGDEVPKMLESARELRNLSR